MNEILEHKGNILIIKEDNILKLYSFKSLVSVYDTETKEYKDIPYTYINGDGNSCSYSVTTTRHQIKFKNYILNRGL